jgi:hypothetical protein
LDGYVAVEEDVEIVVEATSSGDVELDAEVAH